MKLLTYVNYPGNCAEAFQYYEKHLGGKIVFQMTHGDAPERRPGTIPGWENAVLHARIDLGETMLLGADIPDAGPMRSAYLSIMADGIDDAERMFAALSDGGEVFMPIQETFFAVRFAQLRDKFGANWMIVTERPLPPR